MKRHSSNAFLCDSVSDTNTELNTCFSCQQQTTLLTELRIADAVDEGVRGAVDEVGPNTQAVDIVATVCQVWTHVCRLVADDSEIQRNSYIKQQGKQYNH